MKILVCDDDQSIVDAICIYLVSEGYECVKAYDGKQALDLINKMEFHLIITDVMMPLLDGLQLTHSIRQAYNTPIIILSARVEQTDKIIGLTMGADDYIVKPFSPLELIARVKSQLRRYTQLGSLDEQAVFKSGGLEMNDDTKETLVDGAVIKLTPLEYNILFLLLKNKGQVFSIEQIYEKVWNEKAYLAENTVAVHIRHIREKIEINPKNPKYLKVVWGIGYKIEKYK